MPKPTAFRTPRDTTLSDLMSALALAVRHYAAFLRGISPTNAKMPELKACFEAAGFTNVKTVGSTGNVVFGARAASNASLARNVEKAMSDRLHRTFLTIVRPLDILREMLDTDPYAEFRLKPGSKRIVTFLRDAPKSKSTLPIELDGARILSISSTGREAFSAYVPSPRGPLFMTLIQKTFGDAVTTRTWDSVKKVVLAATPPPG